MRQYQTSSATNSHVSLAHNTKPTLTHDARFVSDQPSLKIHQNLISSLKRAIKTPDRGPIVRSHYGRLFVPLRESVPYWEGGSKQRSSDSDTKTCYARHWSCAKRKPTAASAGETETPTEREEGRRRYTETRRRVAISTDQQDTGINIWGFERRSVCVLPSVHELRYSISD